MRKFLPHTLAVMIVIIALSAAALPSAALPTRAETPEKVIMGYFPEWKVNGYPVERIPAAHLTHILYAFGNISPAGTCSLFQTPYLVTVNLEKLKALKEQYPHLKVLISLGGWSGSSDFSRGVRTEKSRERMVTSCIEMWIKGGTVKVPGVIDGIDVDWEFPGVAGMTNNFSPDDKANFVAVMELFRAALDEQGKIDGRYYSLSAALSPNPSAVAAGLDLPALAKVMDYFNIMTYDFHGGWSKTTNFHNGLYAVSDDPAGESGATANVDSAVQRYIEGGVPPEKIVVGMPFYGRGWTGVEPGAAGDGLFQPVTGALEIGYRGILEQYTEGYTVFRHPQARVPYVYSAATKTFIAYDDPESIQEKAQYILDRGLAGGMFWELSQDTTDALLSGTLCRALRGTCE